MLTKKAVKVRIKAEPNTFRDEKGWTKLMKGWFFPRKLQEREFTITEEQQIPYALELITQSYIISDRRL
jgi:predicted transport protein